MMNTLGWTASRELSILWVSLTEQFGGKLIEKRIEKKLKNGFDDPACVNSPECCVKTARGGK